MAIKFYTADLETDPFLHGRVVKPFASAVHDGSLTEVFWGGDCIQNLLTFLRDKHGVCYMHNGGRFDFHHLLPHMRTEDLDPSPMLIGNRIVELGWRDIRFRDSYALVPRPLKSWQKEDISIDKLEASVREKNRAEIIKYLRGDVSYLHAMISEMRDLYFPSGTPPLTLAGLTFKIMDRDFGVKVCRTTRGFDRSIRPYYFGGRVEYWRLGRIDGQFSILDINSAYPAAMMQRHFWGSDCVVTHNTRAKIDPYSMYRVECADPRGFFPLRTRDGLFFPAEGGTFRVSGWELSLYDEYFPRGYKVLVRIRPKKLQDFAEYTKHFYNLKEHAKDKGERYFAKLILNSFYGKLAQNDENYTETLIRPYREWPVGGETWSLVADDKLCGRSIFQRPAPKLTDPYSVATGASITGHVRAVLGRVIAANSGILYCDTDSVIAPNPILGVKTGSGLGEWKMEMKSDIVFIAGKKLYCAHNADSPWFASKPARNGFVFVAGKGWTSDSAETWKTASKGVRLSVGDIIAVATGESRTYAQDAPSYGLGRSENFITRTIVRADRRGEK